MCSKHVFASIFYVNYRNTAYSSLVCTVPDLLSFGTSAPPGELNIIYLLGLPANIEPTMGECSVCANS